MSVERGLRPIDRDLTATLAVIGYSLAVAVGFSRVFAGWGFMPDLAAIVVTGHLVSFALRRGRVSGWVAVPLVALVLGLLVAYQNYRDTLNWLLPTAETWRLFHVDTDLVRELFPTAVTPVPYAAGWAVLTGLVMALAVVLADTFAFRAEARAETLVPGGVLFIFVSALGSDRLRVISTMLLVGAGIVAVVALRSLYEGGRVEVVASRRATGRAIPVAVGTALVVAVVAGAVGPRIPGATAEPLYDTQGRNGGVTEVLSPLVDIRGRLVSQRSNELFRVSSSEPSYWRITTLAEFDGNQFTIPDRPLEAVDGTFGAGRPGAVEFEQQIVIQDLRGRYVPAAAEPTQASGRDLRWNGDISTLLVVGDELEAGERFRIVSSSPRVQPMQLQLATSNRPPDRIYLELPADFPDEVRQVARQVTADHTSVYDRALALQDWFQSEFTYSLEIQKGHDSSAIENFLRTRVGYCEQFAATFAAMARSIGIPSRVAVGFTQGLQTPDGWYSVLGRNAHAWPEVWFDDIGWVQFEPTPGRGAPGTEQYTGLAPAQDAAGPGDGTGDGAPAPTTTVAGPDDSTPGAAGGSTNDIPGLGPDGGFDVPLEDIPTTDHGIDWRPWILVAVLALAAAAPAVVRRVRRRLHHLVPPEQRVIDAWERARRAAVGVGVPGRDSMTPKEWAAATARALPVASRPMASLATTVEGVAFAPPGRVDLSSPSAYGTNLARECANWSRQIEEIAHDSLTAKARIVRYFTVYD